MEQLRKKILSSQKIVVVIQSDFKLPTTAIQLLEEAGEQLSLESWKHSPAVLWTALGIVSQQRQSPSAVHWLAFWLQEEKRLHRVFSLDWGDLERAAGVEKQRIVKVLGNLDRATCDHCGAFSSKRQYRTAIEKKRAPLACPDPICRKQLMRPNVVLDGVRFTKDYVVSLNTELQDVELLLLCLQNPDTERAILERIAQQVPRHCYVAALCPARIELPGVKIAWLSGSPAELAQQLLDRPEPLPPEPLRVTQPLLDPAKHQSSLCQCVLL